MARGVISYDTTTGDLKEGLLWLPEVGLEDDSTWMEGIDCNHGPTFQDVVVCKVNKRHTYPRFLHSCVKLLGHARLADFPYFPGCGYFVSKAFTERLSKMSFVGCDVRDVIVVAANEDRLPNARIFMLDCQRALPETRFRLKGGSGRCPHCDTEPMICPGCGRNNSPVCYACDKWTVYNPEAPEYSDPKGYAMDFPDGPTVVDGRTWQGDDWFHIGGTVFATNRFKTWMERTHTTGIKFNPVLVNVEGMDPALLKKLKEDR